MPALPVCGLAWSPVGGAGQGTLLVITLILDSGQWTVDSGQCVDSGQWTVDSGQ